MTDQWKQELHFFPYFRSWDLFAGFPANLAGIAVLQKYMADEIGIKSGPIIASILFVFVFVITNHWEAIGFLLAAKSVFRFGAYSI